MANLIFKRGPDSGKGGRIPPPPPPLMKTLMSMDEWATSKSTQLSTKGWVKLLLLLENSYNSILRPF